MQEWIDVKGVDGRRATLGGVLSKYSSRPLFENSLEWPLQAELQRSVVVAAEVVLC